MFPGLATLYATRSYIKSFAREIWQVLKIHALYGKFSSTDYKGREVIAQYYKINVKWRSEKENSTYAWDATFKFKFKAK